MNKGREFYRQLTKDCNILKKGKFIVDSGKGSTPHVCRKYLTTNAKNKDITTMDHLIHELEHPFSRRSWVICKRELQNRKRELQSKENTKHVSNNK